MEQKCQTIEMSYHRYAPVYNRCFIFSIPLLGTEFLFSQFISKHSVQSAMPDCALSYRIIMIKKYLYMYIKNLNFMNNEVFFDDLRGSRKLFVNKARLNYFTLVFVRTK